MPLKLKARLAAMASALALAGGLSLIFAGPASAVTDEPLCAVTPANKIYCVYFDNGASYGAVLHASFLLPPPGPDLFSYPVTKGVTGEIFYGGTNSDECLSQNGVSHIIQMEICADNANQKWTVGNRTWDGMPFLTFENQGLYLYIDTFTDYVDAYGNGNDSWNNFSS